MAYVMKYLLGQPPPPQLTTWFMDGPKDALALIRIVNAARSTPADAGDKSVVTRLYQNLKALEAWSQSEW